MNQANNKKKNILIISGIVGAVVAWFIAAHFFGPDSKYEFNRRIASLREDSIALQQNFRPIGEYTYFQDIDAAVDELRDLGKPLRFGNTKTDSVRMFSNPETSRLARYNVAKCDSILKDILPMWRAKMAFVLNNQLKEQSTIVRLSQKHEDYTGLEIYSLKYLSKDEIEHDALRWNGVFKNLGFKSIFYAASPENEGTEYTWE